LWDILFSISHQLSQSNGNFCAEEAHESRNEERPAQNQTSNQNPNIHRLTEYTAFSSTCRSQSWTRRGVPGAKSQGCRLCCEWECSSVSVLEQGGGKRDVRDRAEALRILCDRDQQQQIVPLSINFETHLETDKSMAARSWQSTSQSPVDRIMRVSAPIPLPRFSINRDSQSTKLHLPNHPRHSSIP
jgi:hypothetical protein